MLGLTLVPMVGHALGQFPAVQAALWTFYVVLAWRLDSWVITGALCGALWASLADRQGLLQHLRLTPENISAVLAATTVGPGFAFGLILDLLLPRPRSLLARLFRRTPAL